MNARDESKIEKILKSVKVSMEVEGFTIDQDLEETGRKILKGEIDINEYINQCKEQAARIAANEI
jgi:hypothetical protein